MIVAHLDLDAFFAAVEELEQPELRWRPLVVGGDPHGRGVVATANYVARQFGIHSAMSSAEALRRCPAAVFVRPRHRVYKAYSEAVWRSVREVCPTVEQTGIDEGYLDVEAVAGEFRRARDVAEAVQAAVRASTRLSCSLGVATCKVVAKVASDRRKPGGLTVVPPGRERPSSRRSTSACCPVSVPGPRPGSCGRASPRSAALADLADDELSRLLPGKIGVLLRDRARGIDPRPLETESEWLSISTEETFERDVADRDALHEELRRMSRSVAAGSPGGSRSPHGHDEGALSGLRDQEPVTDAPGRDRGPGPHRRARVRLARPGARRSSRRAQAGRSGCLEPRAFPPARARLSGEHELVGAGSHPARRGGVSSAPPSLSAEQEPVRPDLIRPRVTAP